MDNLTDNQWEAIIKKTGCAFKPLHIIKGNYANTSLALRLYISLLAKKEVFDDIEKFIKVFDVEYKIMLNSVKWKKFKIQKLLRVL